MTIMDVQGDLCLAEIAECIKKAYANFGYCYRIGGDEFCVLLKTLIRKIGANRNFTSAGRKAKKDYIFTNGFLWISFVLKWDIVAVKDKADRDMYQYKYERKNRNGMVRTCTIAIFLP